MIARVACLPFVLMSALLGQQTWIVDPSGTGQFTDLAAAIAAANTGDTLLLRGGGDYGLLYYLHTALKIVGEPHVPRPRVAVLSISGIAAGSPEASIAGIDLDECYVYSATTFEDVVMVRCMVNNAAATLNLCTLGGTVDLYGYLHIADVVTIQQGDVVLNQCTAYGSGAVALPSLGCSIQPGYEPVRLYSGSVTIANCTLHGPDSMWATCGMSPPGAGLWIDGGTATITRSAVFGGQGGAAPAVELWPAGVLLVDPSTQFTPAFAGGTAAFLPATRGQGAAPGATLTCQVDGPPLAPAALVATVGMRAPVAVPEGLAWVDPNNFVVFAIGVADGAGTLPASLPVPTAVSRGLAVTVQGVVVPPGGSALVAAVPVILHVL